jgi:hypothetical protein
MVVLAIVMIMRVLRLSPALVALARTRSAVIRLTIRVVVARTIARGLVAGLAGFAGCMVYAAHFAALLPHALIVYYVLSPLDVPSLLWLGAQTQDT